jgi:biopolymer transport protein ExbB
MNALLLHCRTLWSSLAAGGWLMGPLIVTAFLIWFSYLALLLRLRNALLGQDADDFDLERRLVSPQGSQTVESGLAGLPGAVPRMVRQVLALVRVGVPFREACRQSRFAAIDEYSYAMIWLGALVTAAPLLGLLGTVLGMVETFDAVALRTGEVADLVAAGISHALITTEMGLIQALPGSVGLAHLYRLYKRLTNRLDRCESHLALVFEHRLPAAQAVAGGASP